MFNLKVIIYMLIILIGYICLKNLWSFEEDRYSFWFYSFGSINFFFKF